MQKLWNALTILLLILGVLWATLVNPVAIYAFKADDVGGAMASAALRLVPFLLAARWTRNAALGRRTGWMLRIVLALWIMGWLSQVGAGRG